MSEEEIDSKKTTDDEHIVEKSSEPINAALFEKSQSLVEIANNTFKELCLTLENEQTKLLELEERRKKLQEEMQRLKMEIEEEKKSYNLSIMDSCSDNLDMLSTASSSNIDNLEELRDQAAQENMEKQETDHLSEPAQSQLDTWFEVDENNDDDGVDLLQVDTAAKKIHRQLQSVAAECIIEQCKNVDATDLSNEVFESASRP